MDTEGVSTNIEVLAMCIWYGDGEGLRGGAAVAHVDGKLSRKVWGLVPIIWSLDIHLHGPLAILQDGLVENFRKI